MKYLIIYLIFTFNVFGALPIAHRGASGHAPENTISAIKKATELGAKFIEIDVHMTKDQHVVAIHDSSVDRTTNSSGDVYDYNLSELSKLDAGSWFSKNYKGERVPTLLEVLNNIKSDQILIIEVKYGKSKYPNIEKKILEDIIKSKKHKNVILKSFDKKILNEFKLLAPGIERLYCTIGGNSWMTIDIWLRFSDILKDVDYNYIQIHKYFLSKKLLKRAKDLGVKVVVWDVHENETIMKFLDMGVDFIETDFPRRVLKIKKEVTGETRK